VNDKNAEDKRHCKTERHDEHLCYMIALGLNVTDAEEYQALTAEPQFRCGHCGRTARSDENLCVPTHL
jgi:hypothetical protein